MNDLISQFRIVTSEEAGMLPVYAAEIQPRIEATEQYKGECDKSLCEAERDYGTFVAAALDAVVIQQWTSTDWYHGDIAFILKKGEWFGFMPFWFGSCPGCDLLQGVPLHDFNEWEELLDIMLSGTRWAQSLAALCGYLLTRDWTVAPTVSELKGDIVKWAAMKFAMATAGD